MRIVEIALKFSRKAFTVLAFFTPCLIKICTFASDVLVRAVSEPEKKAAKIAKIKMMMMVNKWVNVI